MYIRKNLYKYEQEVCKDTSTTAAHEEHEEKKEITQNCVEKQANKDGASKLIQPVHEE